MLASYLPRFAGGQSNSRMLGWFIAILLAFGLASSQTASAQDLPPIPEVSGPKRAIAVGQIEATGGFDVAENWDVGNGLASMLTTELINSGRFEVAERPGLTSVINERQMQASGVTAAANSGSKLTAAEYIIVGSVTDFGAPSKGGGLSLGSSGLGGALGGIGVSNKSGKVGLDLRVVEVSSGKIVDAFVVSSKASKSGFALKGGYKGIVLGGDQFSKTPLGEATREALHKAVIEIARILDAQPWKGQVVAYSDAEGVAIINLGLEAGIENGDRFRIERVGDVLTDPSTGEILKEARYLIGDLEVTTVEEKVSYAAFRSSNGTAAPERGDDVLPMSALSVAD